MKYYAQSIWVERSADGYDCSNALIHLVASKGLELTIQP
jgi:hypothetical protein